MLISIVNVVRSTRKTVAGEFGIGIIPVDKSAFDAAKKHNLKVVYPEDGIPWIPEGVAIFKKFSSC